MPHVVTMSGRPRERGLAYGESARPLIAEAASRWMARAGSAQEELLHALVDDTRFRETARQVTPYLVDEIEGIAQASGVDERLVWALNLLDEGWWIGRRRRADAAAGGCSAVALEGRADQPAMIAQ